VGFDQNRLQHRERFAGGQSAVRTQAGASGV
jgi:hypothetical protein